MLGTALILVAILIVNILLSVFPYVSPTDNSLPQQVLNAFEYFGVYISHLNFILPFSELYDVWEWVFRVVTVIYGFKFGVWAFSFVPIFGGRGKT